MSPEILGLIGFGCIFGLMALGMPIGSALGLVGLRRHVSSLPLEPGL